MVDLALVRSRFWNRVKRGEGCWEWQGPQFGGGYCQVTEIRRRWDAGEQGAVLAREFGVSKATISRAVHRSCWPNVE